jgi:PAS domain S-box-containing protein
MALIIVGGLISLLIGTRRRAGADAPPRVRGASISVEWKTRVGLVSGLGLLVVVAAIAYVSIVRLRGDVSWVVHTQEVLTALETLGRATLQAETAQGRYVITSDPTQLPRFEAAVSAIDAGLARVRGLTADNAEQQRRIETLAAVIRERVQLETETIERRRANDVPAARALVGTGRGRQLQDEIHRQVDELRSAEDGLLRAREGQAESAAASAKTIIVFSATLAFALAATSVFLIGDDFRLSRRAEAALRAANQTLEARVALRTAELRAANEALHVGEQRLASIIETAMDGIVTVDENQRVTLFNSAAERMFGCTAAEALGQPLDRFLPAHLRAAHAEHIRAFAASDVTRRTMGQMGAVRGVRASGEEFPIEASIAQSRAAGEKLFTAILRDITERARAELQLREQASLLDAAPVLVRDMDDRITFWGSGAQRLYGWTSAEALGRVSHELFRTRFPVAPAEVREILHRSGTWEGELIQSGRDGQRIVVASQWILHRDAAGRAVRVLEVHADVSARLEAEERLQDALDAGGMGTWVWNVDGGVLEWDAAAPAMLRGAAEGAGAGQPAQVLTFVHPDDRPAVEAVVTAVLTGVRDTLAAEFRVARTEGPVQWMAFRGRCERDAAGRPRRMVGIYLDATDRKRVEEAQLRSQKLEALGTLAGGIAHDFNNILTAIVGNLGLMMEEVRPDDPRQQYLRRIDRASTRAIELTRRILAFGRRQESVKQVATLAPIVEEAVHLLRATLPAMIAIRRSIPPGLPPVAVDATQLHQVIMNLGTNAMHAMRERGGVLEVRADVVKIDDERVQLTPGLKVGQYVRVSVSDDGHGIDKATLSRIFDPFFTTKAAGEGTGLGLSVVHGIMESHGGTITVYSELGTGTVFHLYFPVADARIPVEHAVASRVLPVRQSRVLFVDDEEEITAMGGEMLTRIGYDVTGFTDPMEALRTFRARPRDFDIVVTDMAMPGMSGLELARSIRGIRPGIPVILCSGLLGEEALASAHRLGLRGSVEKPYTVHELARALADALAEGAGPA